MLWGDADCGGAINLGDTIAVARKLVDLAVNQSAGCPQLGATVSVDGTERAWEDIDCGGSLTLGDAIGIARFLVDLSVNQAQGCPHIADEVQVTGG